MNQNMEYESKTSLPHIFVADFIFVFEIIFRGSFILCERWWWDGDRDIPFMMIIMMGMRGNRYLFTKVVSWGSYKEEGRNCANHLQS